MRVRALLDADWHRLKDLSGERRCNRPWTSAFSPRFATVVLIRIAQQLEQTGWRRLAKLTSLLNFLLFGIEVPAKLQIGPGLVVPHTVGTILGAGYIGANVTIFQQVTLGAKFADFSFDMSKRPYVSDGVIIGAGAKILGPVRLGERARIGANAVVLQDVPADCLAVGVPARVVRISEIEEGTE
jgi:serine O-acetyltransferase